MFDREVGVSKGRRALAIARDPRFWLLLQAAGVLAWLILSGRLVPEIVPDTRSYRRILEGSTLAGALSNVRTPGYPLFLKLAALVGRGYDLVPALQATTYLVAVGMWFGAVRRYTGSAWLAFAMATPLLYLELWSLVARIQPDFLATSMALVAIACVVRLATKPRSLTLWTALACSLVLAYQLRPAFQFLVPLVPLLGLILRYQRTPRLRRLMPWLIGLSAAAVVPLLLYCGLRLATVGHFGLVSFDGFSTIGTAATFLDSELVKELPQRHQRMAEVMLRRRTRQGMLPYTSTSDTRVWKDQYNRNQWRLAVPLAASTIRAERRRAREREEAGELDVQRPRPGRIEHNQLLADLSREILRRRPALYFRWMRDNFLIGLRDALGYASVRWSLVLTVLTLPTLLIGRRSSKAPEPAAGHPAGVAEAGSASSAGLAGALDPSSARVRALLALVLVAVGYFLSYLGLVVLVSVPMDRYVVAMVPFLPVAAAGVLFELWRRLLGRTIGKPFVSG